MYSTDISINDKRKNLRKEDSGININSDNDYNNNSTRPLVTETINGRTRSYHASINISDSSTRLEWRWNELYTNGIASHSWAHRIDNFFPAKSVQWFKQMFLPVGYPNSCHAVYARVHSWQFIETLLGSTVGVLCSEAMLSSLGISESSSTGGAVAIQWALKDGLGEIGKLFFIQRFANSFDAMPKSWKLFGEVSCLLGSALQLATLAVPPGLFLLFASAGFMFRSVHFSIWSATHMTFTKNFALTGNVADVVAKDDSQMSVAHLLGLLIGVGLIAISHNPLFIYAIFVMLSPAHFYATRSLLRATQFKVLNRASTILLCESWVGSSKIPPIHVIQSRMSWFGEVIARGYEKSQINIGSTVSREFGLVQELDVALERYSSERYILNYIPRLNSVGIVFFEGAETDDILKATLNAVKLWDLMQSGTYCGDDEAYQWVKNEFEGFKISLGDHGWMTDVVFYGDAGHRIVKDNT